MVARLPAVGPGPVGGETVILHGAEGHFGGQGQGAGCRGAGNLCASSPASFRVSRGRRKRYCEPRVGMEAGLEL